MKIFTNKITRENYRLEEVSPKYFQQIIEWRNDDENKKFLNQPFIATIETQTDWYKRYLEDDFQIVYMMIDRNNTPFGMIGLKQIDVLQRMAEVGSLIVIKEYRGSTIMAEALICFYETVFQQLDVLYGCSMKDNKKILKLNENLGYIMADRKFPSQDSQKNCDNLLEVCVRKENFYQSKIYQSFKG